MQLDWQITMADRWRMEYPGASIGMLAMGQVANPERHDRLDERKAKLELELRSRFDGYDRRAFKALPILSAYGEFYRRFGKTYHVQLQLESLVLKGKPIPKVAALVEAMFMAELENQLLTAGHDLDRVVMPVQVAVAQGSEAYVKLNGQEQVLKAGDMFIADARGVMSSVLYGPDRRTSITPSTRRVLFTVYAPPGVDAASVAAHLDDLRSNVMLVSENARVEAVEVYNA